MKRRALFFITTITLLFLSVQFSYAQSGKSRSLENLNPAITFYHLNSQLTELHFKCTSRELVYNKNESTDFTAQLQVAFRVYAVNDLKVAVDTGRVVLVDINNQHQFKEIKGKIDLHLEEGKNYRLKIEFTDKKRKHSFSSTYFIYKKDRLNRQNFILTNEEDKVIYAPYVNDKWITVASNLNANHSVQVRVYKKEFGLAPPPFSDYKLAQFKYDADSVYTAVFSDKGKLKVQMPPYGFIHIVIDSSSREGITVFKVGKYFPRFAKIEDLIEPLRFLCSSDEYKRIENAADKKIAVDRFWLDKSGSYDKGRDLIRNFYSRAEIANKKFSSYTEGWKTDRGMIYLIFGEPTNIDTSEDSETWIYGDRFSSNSVRFNFIKVENPFSENDFFLQRLPSYKPEWYRAVDSWRLGKAYNFTN